MSKHTTGHDGRINFDWYMLFGVVAQPQQRVNACASIGSLGTTRQARGSIRNNRPSESRRAMTPQGPGSHPVHRQMVNNCAAFTDDVEAY